MTIRCNFSRLDPPTRPRVTGLRTESEMRAREVARRALNEERRRPLIPDGKRVREYGT